MELRQGPLGVQLRRRRPTGITTPLVRDDDGELRSASWPEALDAAARGLAAARAPAPACSSAAGSPSRTPTRTPSSPGSCSAPTTSTSAPGRTRAEEADVPRRHVAGHGPMAASPTPTWRRAPAVLLVGFEPEEESPIVFLRLRKACRKRGTAGATPSPRSPRRGLAKLGGTLHPAAPGTEAEVLGRRSPTAPGPMACRRGRRGAATPARVDPGRRAAGDVPGRAHRRRPRWPTPPAPGSPGSRAAPASAARSRPARCRACCPAAARSPTPRPAPRSAAAWGVDALPGRARPRHRRHPRRGGRRASSARSWSAASTRPTCPDPARRWQRAGRGAASSSASSCAPSAVTERRRRRAAGRPAAREGRHLRQLGGPRSGRSRRRSTTNAMSDYRVLDMLADELGVVLGTAHASREVRAEIGPLGPWDGRARRGPDRARGRAVPQRRRRAGACWPRWHHAARRRPAAGRRAVPRRHRAPGRAPAVGRHGRGARASATATLLTVSHGRRPDHAAGRGDRRWPTAWSGCRPTRAGSTVRATLGVDAGAVVTITKGGAA